MYWPCRAVAGLFVVNISSHHRALYGGGWKALAIPNASNIACNVLYDRPVVYRYAAWIVEHIGGKVIYSNHTDIRLYQGSVSRIRGKLVDFVLTNLLVYCFKFSWLKGDIYMSCLGTDGS